MYIHVPYKCTGCCAQSDGCVTLLIGPCQQYTVGANIMSCKSEDEWRRVGVTQCGLRGRMDVSELVEVEVSTGN